MKFEVIKILDYKNRTPELKASNNKFAPLILAQLAALEKVSAREKLDNKLVLIKELLKKKWKKDDIRQIFNFIDWLVAHPEDLDVEYNEKLNEIAGEHNMELPPLQRIGYKRGIEEGLTLGREEGLEEGRKKASEILIQLLTLKFKYISENHNILIENASYEDLIAWSKKILFSKTIEEVFEN